MGRGTQKLHIKWNVIEQSLWAHETLGAQQNGSRLLSWLRLREMFPPKIAFTRRLTGHLTAEFSWYTKVNCYGVLNYKVTCQNVNLNQPLLGNDTIIRRSRRRPYLIEHILAWILALAAFKRRPDSSASPPVADQSLPVPSCRPPSRPYFLAEIGKRLGSSPVTDGEQSLPGSRPLTCRSYLISAEIVPITCNVGSESADASQNT